MAEWSKALVLGTSHFDGVGSNPTAANTFFFTSFFYQLFLMSFASFFILLYSLSLLVSSTTRDYQPNRRSGLQTISFPEP